MSYSQTQQTKHDVPFTPKLPKPGIKEQSWKYIDTWDSYLTACNPKDDTDEEQVTKCVKDTCLVLPLAAAQDLQTLGLGSSPAARSLIDDRPETNKRTNINKTAQQTKEKQYDYAMDGQDLPRRRFWRKNR